ncbi:MAG TPA: hypothetical protein VHN14_06055 [Kofleriaceae bacterium]|nr:hypothetical protein [Kofleriaceae bacterium]
MGFTIDEANEELRKALAGPEDDVFYDVVAISDGLLRSGHSDEALTVWAERAARGIQARGIPPSKLVCYDTLDARLSPLIFSISDPELATIWPAWPLSNLRSVRLGEADIRWDAMPDSDWPSLHRVSVFGGPGVQNGLLPWLGRQELPQLRELAMPSVDASNAGFLALARSTFWTRLEHVNVGYNVWLGGPWPAMPRAHVLEIPNTHATIDDLRALMSVPLPQLEHLNITNNIFENAGFDVLVERPLPALTDLEIRACRFTDGYAWRGLSRAQWPSLRRLDLQDTLSDPLVLIAAAPVLRGLRRLEIGSCDLDDACAAVLASIEMPELAHLDLSYNQLTDKGIAQLAASTWPRLKYLDVSVNPIGDRGVAALTRMPWWNTLETIKLVRVELTDAGLATLAQAAPRNVRELSVGPREWYSQDAYDRLRAAVPAGTYL